MPIRWDATNHVVWKTAVPGEGHSSPILWGNRLFLTSALKQTEERCLLCFERETGKLLWQQTVLRAPLEAKNSENSFASSTPATDGQKIYVTFLDGKDVVAAACDFTGKSNWLVRPGQFVNQHGFSHNPTLFEDKVIVCCDSKGENFVVAGPHRRPPALEGPARDPTAEFSAPLIPQAGRARAVGAARQQGRDQSRPRNRQPALVGGRPVRRQCDHAGLQ